MTSRFDKAGARRAIVALLCLAACVAVSGKASAQDVPGDFSPAPPPPTPENRESHKSVVPGAVVFLSSYGLATFVGLAPTVDLAWERALGGEPHPEQDPDHYLPLLVPLAGPIWSLGYSDIRKDSGSVFWISAAGIGEVVGATLFTVEALAPDRPVPHWALSPTIGSGYAGEGAPANRVPPCRAFAFRPAAPRRSPRDSTGARQVE